MHEGEWVLLLRMDTVWLVWVRVWVWIWVWVMDRDRVDTRRGVGCG